MVAVAAVVVTAGCSGGTGQRTDGAGRSATPPEPGVVARRQAAGDSAALLAQYDATAAAHPALAARLRPLRAEVALHVAAFGGKAAPTPTATATATPALTPTPTPTASTPTTAAAALASLAAAEQRLADRRAAVLLNVPGELARLLASVAAAGAGHVALLGAKTGTGAGR